jgi:hypothetical protein
MRQIKDNELNTRIHDFLDKKFTQFPELRDSFKLGDRNLATTHAAYK